MTYTKDRKIVIYNYEERRKIMTKRESELWSRRIAAFVYATAVLETSEGSYIVSETDIEHLFGEQTLPKDWSKDEDFVDEIKNALFEYPGITGGPEATSVEDSRVKVYKDGNKLQFDLDLFTDYAAITYADVDDEDEDEDGDEDSAD